MSANLQSRQDHELSLPVKSAVEAEEHFYVQRAGDAFVYSVQKCETGGELVKRSPAPEPSEVCREPQRLPGPVGTRVVAYRKGRYELEIDIPAITSGAKGTPSTIYFLLPPCLVSLFLCGLGLTSDRAPECFLLSVPCVGILIAISLAIRALFVHENLVVTPTCFRIRRTVEFVPQLRDSVHNAHKARGNHRLLEMIFYRQVARPTSTLSGAEVKACVTKDMRKTNKRLSLMEGGSEHKLYSVLSSDERKWLARAINETLRNIKERPDDCCSSS